MSALVSLTRRLGHQQWFATTMRVLVPADRLIGRMTKGRVVAFGLVPTLVLTSTGRRSGKPRSNPLLYVPDGDAYVVIGSNWGQRHHPSWTFNLLAQPAAEVDVRGRRIPVRAEQVVGADRDRLFDRLVQEWPAYRTYVQRAAGREIKVFRLTPTP
ncbi:nitroreductase family deazaflavin-dependent oxidoreductase [Micromonospora sp. WMMD1128]|uniref:nitroreductase family deazaflavin-dependent oxidoreductase n=1 Tax=unclassified Micromonospora TaxID=2617518 RepID=UPI00248B2CA6|nr:MULTISPECIES: nitroreductase family deazaflavin-dependent oxidoreductase [unclassified Micromonospora]WBB72246.1 nitroreductase family deazaflavin-dependent oxidoreductase [Micromonospora sp. WMMD1128]WFE34294.1 nitroreductase family deazaflavin-dependent oxidoreductase [Micromonospora sp. WMMD975]